MVLLLPKEWRWLPRHHQQQFVATRSRRRRKYSQNHWDNDHLKRLSLSQLCGFVHDLTKSSFCEQKSAFHDNFTSRCCTGCTCVRFLDLNQVTLMEFKSGCDGMKELNWDHSPKNDHRNQHHRSKNDSFDRRAKSSDQEIKFGDWDQHTHCSDYTNQSEHPENCELTDVRKILSQRSCPTCDERQQVNKIPLVAKEGTALDIKSYSTLKCIDDVEKDVQDIKPQEGIASKRTFP